MRTSSFRGLIASASLKHAPGKLPTVCAESLSTFPRLDCLGLIEASIRRWQPCRTASFPRLDCLGLIEARKWTMKRSGSSVRFRGLIASASLKLLAGTRTRPESTFPSFRGLIASASLKPRSVSARSGYRLHSFPRLDCLGLIEARQYPSARTSTVAFPRLDCLGPIEAAP